MFFFLIKHTYYLVGFKNPADKCVLITIMYIEYIRIMYTVENNLLELIKKKKNEAKIFKNFYSKRELFRIGKDIGILVRVLCVV